MKKLLITLGLVAVVAIGYVAMKPNDSYNDSSYVKNDSSKKSFLDFVNSDGSYQCSVTQNVGGISSLGTVFVSKGKIRGEFSTDANGMKVNSSLVVKDGYTYTWSSMMPNMVYKIKSVEPTTTNTAVETSGTYSFNASQIGSYECKDWSLDMAKFELPKDAKIMDIPTAVPTTKPATQTSQDGTTNSTSSGEKTFTMAEVATHSNDKSCYSVINGNVYDLTSYIYKHKGGASKILKICGKDGTSLFEGQHGGQEKPEAMLASLKIGVLK